MSLSSTFPAFESHGGRLEVFNDGHCPETFRFHQHERVGDMGHGKNDGDLADSDVIVTPRIVRYDRLPPTAPTPSTATSPAPVHIYDDVLNPNTARMLYKVTASNRHVNQTANASADVNQTSSRNLEGESPWGTYVTIKEALEWIEWNARHDHEGQPDRCDNDDFEEYFRAWRQKMVGFHERSSPEEKKEEKTVSGQEQDRAMRSRLDDMDYVRHALAVEAVAAFFLETIPHRPGTAPVAKGPSSNEMLFDETHILKQAHGVAVWALSSSPGQAVSYHVDYAELLRYEYNVTVPPLWAGTVQCSALWNDRHGCQDESDEQCMRGGEFCVNLRGLAHYSEHGYKGNLSGDSAGGWRRPDPKAGGVDVNEESQWVTIPYAFNRGIVHHGDLPHMSVPINGIGADGNSPVSRVIVGFNVFGHDVGVRIAKAPEHSTSFRRKVRFYRSTINASTKENNGAGGKTRPSGMDLTQIRKNKGLTKLLVLAKREKVKMELRREQEELTRKIWHRLLSHQGKDSSLLRVADIVAEFGRPNDNVDRMWPKSVDVHVHLHHMLSSTRNTQELAQQHDRFQDVEGSAGHPRKWYCVRVAKGNDEILDGGLIPLSMTLDIAECK